MKYTIAKRIAFSLSLFPSLPPSLSLSLSLVSVYESDSRKIRRNCTLSFCASPLLQSQAYKTNSGSGQTYTHQAITYIKRQRQKASCNLLYKNFLLHSLSHSVCCLSP